MATETGLGCSVSLVLLAAIANGISSPSFRANPLQPLHADHGASEPGVPPLSQFEPVYALPADDPQAI